MITQNTNVYTLQLMILTYTYLQNSLTVEHRLLLQIQIVHQTFPYFR